VRRDGEQLRVTAQLIRAEDGTQQWSKTYDRSLSSVFAVQDEIAKDVAQALSVKLDVGTLNLAQGGTTNVEAYDRYLQWRDFRLSSGDPAEARRMVQQLREAVALDPGFVLAWDGLAQSLTRLANRAQPPRPPSCGGGAAAHARVAALAPDSWIVQRERAYALFARKVRRSHRRRQGDHGVQPQSMGAHLSVYQLIFAVAAWRRRQNHRRAQGDRAAAMFWSRDQQWNLTALRRYDMPRPSTSAARRWMATTPSRNTTGSASAVARGTDPQALRDQYRLMQDSVGGLSPITSGNLRPSRRSPRMLEVLRRAVVAQPSC